VNIAIMRTGLPQGRAMHDRPRRMMGRRDEQNASHRHAMHSGGHVPPLLDPQPNHIREGLPLDELRLLIFDLTERHFFLLPSKIKNQKSSIGNLSLFTSMFNVVRSMFDVYSSLSPNSIL
jgi:hypothetical protein